ncbi:hypothetical protein AALO_G00096420 [Alosa alosa]|uniref:RING-type domain-containing protein n=1 Tax=Alosa alosa TaxID=278164 RepID=A0AAV6GWU6_9TELE|nr:hypothetical protein AALO_G00096420 [Alosa alosa]
MSVPMEERSLHTETTDEACTSSVKAPQKRKGLLEVTESKQKGLQVEWLNSSTGSSGAWPYLRLRRCNICGQSQKDHVRILCGHVFCRQCILMHLETQSAIGEYTCPNCRHIYSTRPALQPYSATQKHLQKHQQCQHGDLPWLLREKALKEVLRKTLENLSKTKFKLLKYYLKDLGQIEWAKLKKADHDDIVELLMEAYSTEAGKKILTILQKMNLKQMAKDLERHLTTQFLSTQSRLQAPVDASMAARMSAAARGCGSSRSLAD